MTLNKLKRALKIKYIIFLRLYHSQWVCIYKSNLVGFKKGSFICPFKKFNEAESYAFYRTKNLEHGKIKLSFRHSNFIDYII